MRQEVEKSAGPEGRKMERCLCGIVWSAGGVSYRNRDRERRTGLGFEVSSQVVSGLV